MSPPMRRRPMARRCPVTIRNLVIGTAVAAMMLAAGCGQTYQHEKREEAKQRWSASRATMAVKMAEGCYKRGELTQARQHLDEVLKTATSYAPAYVLAARLAAEKGELDKAHDYADSARTADPKSAEAHYVFGCTEQTLGHNAAALDSFAEAARLAPNEPRYEMARSEMLVDGDRAAEAAVALASGVERMPGRAEIHVALGDVYLLLRRPQEALGCYRIAQRLDPDQAGVRDRLAQALYSSGEFSEAEALLTEILRTEPEFANGWAIRMRADCLLAIGRAGGARELYDRLARADINAAAPRIAMARCDIMESQFPSARRHLEEALRLAPRDTQANALMGYVLVATGHAGEATAHLRLAAQDPTCEGRRTVERLLAMAQNKAAPATEVH